jgi:hypothetical protein
VHFGFICVRDPSGPGNRSFLVLHSAVEPGGLCANFPSLVVISGYFQSEITVWLAPRRND